MILRHFLHTDPVAASYLFGCGGRAAGAIVDPLGDPSPYIKAAEATGMRIRYVIDTHLHADHVSAGRGLADASGAEYVLFAEAAANFPFLGVRDGELLGLGNVTVKVLHTPGHTPEHISLLVTDRTRADEFTPPDHRPAPEPAHSQAAPQKARAAAGRITLNAPLPRSGR